MKFSKNIKIGEFVLTEESPAFILAEAGVNHGGDMDIARRLIDVAAEAGVEGVKFQAFRTEHLILPDVEKAPYQIETTEAGQSQTEMLKKLEVTREQNRMLMDYALEKGVLFLTTPFDEVSLEELDELNLPAYKVASTDTTNIPFLKKIAAKGRPVILSTGMTYLEEIEQVLEEIHPINQDVILLQCTADYPLNDDEVNLRVMDTFRERFEILVGYSDHSVGVGAAPYAVAKGARLLEKHFTLDKTLEGPDHEASLDPVEMKELVKEIRRVETYLGSKEKKPTPAETKTRLSLQKCLVAARDISQGAIISENDFVAKRTGGFGISPMKYKDLVGTAASRDYKKDELFE